MENDPNPYSTPGSDVFAGSSAVGGGEVTDGVIDQLQRTKGWVKFIGVMAFIGAAFMVVGGLVIMAGGAMGGIFSGDAGGALGAGFGFGMGLMYIVMAILYIYPGMKLWAYGKRIDQLLQDRATLTLEAALNEQRSFWKFTGIMMIILLSIYALIIVGVVIAGIGAATMGS
jgi:hypothetical protein